MAEHLHKSLRIRAAYNAQQIADSMNASFWMEGFKGTEGSVSLLDHKSHEALVILAEIMGKKVVDA